MCCETQDTRDRTSYGVHIGHGGLGGCCCCPPHGGFRRFASKAERIEGLEGYRDELTKELEGVNERISELSGS